MIQRLYVHNYRCLQNFELDLREQTSALLIGKNGSGKSSVREALRILQKVARGTNRVKDLVTPGQLGWGRTEMPFRVEIAAVLGGESYSYTLALELPEDFRELRVLEERMAVGGEVLYSRERAQVTIPGGPDAADAVFGIDWHLVALPIVQNKRAGDRLDRFRGWLRRMLILRPVPSEIDGVSLEETVEPDPDLKNFGAWFGGLIAQTPRAYGYLEQYMQDRMPEFADIRNPRIGPEARNLVVQFRREGGSAQVPFKDLSDGEKCLIISALVLASSHVYEPSFCFWDEPDAHLSMAEVGHFIMELRRAFRGPGQLLVTSHDPETIRKFSDENTFYLFRKGWSEPTQVRRLEQVQKEGDLVTNLLLDALEP